MELLPIDWFKLLATWRTGRIVYRRKGRDDLEFELEKFSSMGNGFTFELESVIFYAIAKQAVQDVGASGDVSTYGDDIIVPVEAYDQLIEYLTFFGFTPNKAKSFSSGPFRESCGADWYAGKNIRPFYIKDRLTSARIVGFLNFSLRHTGILDQELRDYLIGQLPKEHRIYGPAYLMKEASDDLTGGGYEVSAGDGHIAVLDYKGTPYKRSRGWSGFTFQTVVKQPRRVRENYGAFTLYPSYAAYVGVSRSRESDPYILRGGDRAKVQRVYTLG
jgi:hypothetical protein